jgi:hypothetical protein
MLDFLCIKPLAREVRGSDLLDNDDCRRTGCLGGRIHKRPPEFANPTSAGSRPCRSGPALPQSMNARAGQFNARMTWSQSSMCSLSISRTLGNPQRVAFLMGISPLFPRGLSVFQRQHPGDRLRRIVWSQGTLAGVTPKVEAHEDQEVCAQRVSLQVVQGRIGSATRLSRRALRRRSARRRRRSSGCQVAWGQQVRAA